MEKIIKGTFISVLFLIILVMFLNINVSVAGISKQEANLVVFGDNIIP